MSADALAAARVVLEQAQEAYAAQPGSVQALVRLGRALSGAGMYKQAVALYTLGLDQHPDDLYLLRHRGHRYITLRQFGLALADLQRAAELCRERPDEPEPPLVPSASGVVLDTLNENVYYHLALAHYLRGEYEQALAGWRQCGRFVTNDDGRAMLAHWTWLTLQRLGRAAEAEAAVAAITPELDVTEYHAYHDAVLVYRGLKDPDALLATLQPAGDGAVNFASLGYGIARWYLAQGQEEAGAALLAQVASAEMWAAFGRIAAEADLAREAAAAAAVEAPGGAPGGAPAPGARR
jgi:tetratricopeptide (TPR) repeat protein